jgi:hypothetical protein
MTSSDSNTILQLVGSPWEVTYMKSYLPVSISAEIQHFEI